MRYSLVSLLFLFLPLQTLAAEPEVPAIAPQSAAYSLDDELIYRINFGSTDDLKLLLGRGANPNAHSTQGDPALTVAIGRNDKEAIAMVKLLLDKGANPNISDKSGMYPIIQAAQNAQGEMVTDLIAKGADVHAVSVTGASLIDIARKTGVAKPIQDVLDKEEAYARSLRTPERFREIIRLYAFHSCSYQYWNYYLSSRQDTAQDAETQKKITGSKTTLAKLLEQIQKYYPSTRTEDLQHISDDSAQKVYDALDAMVSNRNRAEHNIGREDDAKKRCQTIADGVEINFIPSNVRQ